MEKAEGTYPSPVESGGLPRLLWINCRLLHPLIGGDRLRTYHMLRELKRHFHITYVCPTTNADIPEAPSLAEQYCHHLVAIPHHFAPRGSLTFVLGALANSLWGSLPYMAQRYVSPGIRSWVSAHAFHGAFDLVVCDYLVSWVHVMDVPNPDKVPVVVFQHNVESLIWHRHTTATSHPLKRWIFKREAALTIRMEDACARAATGQVTVSPDETAHFRNERGMKNILGDVPTGVDADYFQPSKPASPRTLVFLGSMDWEANRHAVRQFIQLHLPQVRHHHPDVRFIVIGRNPPEDLIQMAAADPAIIVTGTVPDVRPYLAQASIMVLPLEVGGGTRIKVFEALAAGLAVVSTPVGVEGLPVEHGQHAIIAREGAPFTAALLDLLSDPAKQRQIATAGRDLVVTRFSWAAASNRFAELCLPLMQPTCQGRMPE